MADTINEGHDARLARLEEETRFLRVGFDEVRASLKEMAAAITDLAKEAAQREADRETFRRIFKQLEADRDEFTRLWHRTDEMIEKAAEVEKQRLQDELKARGSLLHEIGKSAMYIITGLFLALLLFKMGLK